MRAKYNKAIMSILGGGIAVAAVFWPGFEFPGGPEALVSIGGILTTLLVMFGPKNAE